MSDQKGDAARAPSDSTGRNATPGHASRSNDASAQREPSETENERTSEASTASRPRGHTEDPDTTL